MKLTIKITKEVLRQTMYCGLGDDRVNENCAVAYAVRKLFPKAKVGKYEIAFDGEQPSMSSVKSHLPETAQFFIECFDRRLGSTRLDLPETSFEIDVPDSVIESIGIEEAKAIIEKSSTLELC